VNWSAELVALVPDGVVTVKSTVPLPGGDVAVIEFPVPLTVKDVAATLPNFTPVAPPKY
jgi:hypothetical protein